MRDKIRVRVRVRVKVRQGFELKLGLGIEIRFDKVWVRNRFRRMFMIRMLWQVPLTMETWLRYDCPRI